MGGRAAEGLCFGPSTQAVTGSGFDGGSVCVRYYLEDCDQHAPPKTIRTTTACTEERRCSIDDKMREGTGMTFVQRQLSFATSSLDANLIDGATEHQLTDASIVVNLSPSALVIQGDAARAIAPWNSTILRNSTVEVRDRIAVLKSESRMESPESAFPRGKNLVMSLKIIQSRLLYTFHRKIPSVGLSSIQGCLVKSNSAGQIIGASRSD